jgi:hypothetical protein
VAGAVDVDAHPELTDDLEVVDGGEVEHLGGACGEAAVGVPEAEVAARDVAHDELDATRERAVAGHQLLDPLLGEVEEDRLDEAHRPGVRVAPQDAGQQLGAEEAGEPGEQDGACHDGSRCSEVGGMTRGVRGGGVSGGDAAAAGQAWGIARADRRREHLRRVRSSEQSGERADRAAVAARRRSAPRCTSRCPRGRGGVPRPESLTPPMGASTEAHAAAYASLTFTVPACQPGGDRRGHAARSR